MKATGYGYRFFSKNSDPTFLIETRNSLVASRGEGDKSWTTNRISNFSFSASILSSLEPLSRVERFYAVFLFLAVVGRREQEDAPALLGYISNIPRRLVCIICISRNYWHRQRGRFVSWSKESVGLTSDRVIPYLLSSPGWKASLVFISPHSRESRRASTPTGLIIVGLPPSEWENTFESPLFFPPPYRAPSDLVLFFFRNSMFAATYFNISNVDEFIYAARETMKITILHAPRIL